MFVSRRPVVSGYSYSGHYGGTRVEDSETDSSESEAEADAEAYFVRPQHYQGGSRRYDESEDDDSESEDESDESDDEEDEGNNKYPRSQYGQYPKNKYESDESDDEEDEEEEEEEQCPKQRHKSCGCCRKTVAGRKYDEEKEDGAARMLGRLALSPYGDQQDDRKIVIVKDMHVHLSHNKIRNFAWNKKEKFSKGER